MDFVMPPRLKVGILYRLKAILVGIPKAQFCGQMPPEGKEQFLLNQQEAIKKALRDYNSELLVIFNMNFGHTDPQLLIPNGGLITLNQNEQTVSLNY